MRVTDTTSSMKTCLIDHSSDLSHRHEKITKLSFADFSSSSFEYHILSFLSQWKPPKHETRAFVAIHHTLKGRVNSVIFLVRTEMVRAATTSVFSQNDYFIEATEVNRRE